MVPNVRFTVPPVPESVTVVLDAPSQLAVVVGFQLMTARLPAFAPPSAVVSIDQVNVTLP